MNIHNVTASGTRLIVKSATKSLINVLSLALNLGTLLFCHCKNKLSLTGYKGLRGTLSMGNSLVCNDCRHNCITYEPAKDGTCLCGCH